MFKTNRPSLVSRIFFFVNLLALGALTICYLGAYVNPSKFWIPAFFGLAYPPILLVNIVFTVFWIIRRRKYFLISLVPLFIGFVFFDKSFQINLHDELLPDRNKGLKVMSYNVRLFDLYNWSKNKQTRDQIISFIQKEKPDVLCLQEFYSDDLNEHINADSLMKMLDMPYIDTSYTVTLRKKNHWGIATLSRYPLVSQGRVNFSRKSNNICIYSNVLFNHDTIRVYNMHMQSVHLKNEDYKFIQDLTNDSVVSNEMEGTTKIFRRLRKAFVRRASQSDSVHKHIASCNYPVIVCGDLNDTPSSYAYHTVSDGLTDAFIESGQGFGGTYNGILPSYRIDYIFYGSQFVSNNFHTFKVPYSDHFPVSSFLSFDTSDGAGEK